MNCLPSAPGATSEEFLVGEDAVSRCETMYSPTGEEIRAQRTKVSELEDCKKLLAHCKKVDTVGAENIHEQLVQSTSKGNGSAANPGHFLCAESRTEEEDTRGLHCGAHPGAASEAVQRPGLLEKEGSARPAGAGGSQSVNGAAKAAVSALRNVTMVMDDQDSLKENLDAQAQKLTPAAPRELIKCLVGLCDKYGLEVEATGLRLAARHASQSCAVAQHGHQQQCVSVSTPLVLHPPSPAKALCTSLAHQPLPQARPQPLPPALAEARCTKLVYEPDPVTISARLSYTTALSSMDLKVDEYDQVDQDGAQVERIVVDCLNSDPRSPPPFPRSSPSSSSSSSCSSSSQSSPPSSSSSSSAKRRVGI